jgi:Zn-finger nucleic acid-binding protein
VAYREVPRLCPQCGIELLQLDAGREKWRCQQCGGILVGASELEREVRGDLVLDTVTGARDTRPCPLCREPMTGYRLVGIELDRCATDGAVWFDRGELGRARLEIAGAIWLVDRLER